MKVTNVITETKTTINYSYKNEEELKNHLEKMENEGWKGTASPLFALSVNYTIVKRVEA